MKHFIKDMKLALIEAKYGDLELSVLKSDIWRTRRTCRRRVRRIGVRRHLSNIMRKELQKNETYDLRYGKRDSDPMLQYLLCVV